MHQWQQGGNTTHIIQSQLQITQMWVKNGGRQRYELKHC